MFAKLDDAAFEHQVETWRRQLAAADAGTADLFHLHHLTPINEAAERYFPGVPRIGHLHGTELLMLREIAAGPPPGWEHARVWAERLRRWASACERLLVLSPDAVRRVPELLGVPPEKVVWAPNGFDPAGFRREPLAANERWFTGGAGSSKSRAAGTSRASREASPTRTSRWLCSATRAPCCSTWAATPRSSGSPS